MSNVEEHKEETTVTDQLNTITNLLKSFDERLKIVENVNKTTVNTAEAAPAYQNDSPTATEASATDITKEFEAINPFTAELDFTSNTIRSSTVFT